jgi:hypothetical protein
MVVGHGGVVPFSPRFMKKEIRTVCNHHILKSNGCKMPNNSHPSHGHLAPSSLHFRIPLLDEHGLVLAGASFEGNHTSREIWRHRHTNACSGV